MKYLHHLTSDPDSLRLIFADVSVKLGIQLSESGNIENIKQKFIEKDLAEESLLK